jgi:uncharacterized protein
MHIEELTNKGCLDFLKGKHLGRLACANNGQPYITPCHFVYHSQWVYSFSTVGRKIEWLRNNPLACLEVDDIVTPQEWKSVIVFGRYEELPEAPRTLENRQLAYTLLKKHDLWWEPGYAQTVLHGAARPLDPVYFRLSIDEISGHMAVPS